MMFRIASDQPDRGASLGDSGLPRERQLMQRIATPGVSPMLKTFMRKGQVNGSIQEAAGAQAKEQINIINTGGVPQKRHTL